MSTRATIACKLDDGHYKATYLHFDGYPDHAGRVLRLHYTTLELTESLIAGGDIRSLADNGEAERFADSNRAVTVPTIAALHDFARNCGAEFVYIFQDGAWHSF